MHPETQAFLQGLFGRCDTSRLSAFVTFTAIHPGGEHPTPSRHISLHDTAAMSQALDCLLAANRQGWGAYVGVAPRHSNLGRWKRGTKGDLAELPALFVDVDNLVPETLDKIRNFPLPPSCVVSSGRGLHVYWYLASPTCYFATADAVLRGLAEVFSSDSHMNISQSLRLPGTQNTKEGRNGALCRLIEFHPNHLYDLRDFTAYLPVHPVNSWNLPRQRPICSALTGALLTPEQLAQAKQTIEERLVRHMAGFEKENGFMAALCPYGHRHDRPGKHFNWHKSGVGRCFGRHGRIEFTELCKLFGVAL